MRMIVSKTNKNVKYLFEDDETIDIQTNQIVTDKFIICDLNLSNAEIVYSDEDKPNKWIGNKYKYHKELAKNQRFKKNDKYVEPIEDITA